MSNIKIEKTTTETYTLRGDECSWAKINLDCAKQSVNVMISSDYGEFNYWWGSTGYPPKMFLVTLDMHYAMKKLMGSTANMYEPDWIEREKNFKKLIIQERFDGSVSKDEAREAWDKLKHIFEYCGDNNDIYYSECMQSDELSCVLYDYESIPENTRIKGRVVSFWEHVWKPFTKELERELLS